MVAAAFCGMEEVGWEFGLVDGGVPFRRRSVTRLDGPSTCVARAISPGRTVRVQYEHAKDLVARPAERFIAGVIIGLSVTGAGSQVCRMERSMVVALRVGGSLRLSTPDGGACSVVDHASLQ